MTFFTYAQTASFQWATNISSTGTLIRSNDVTIDEQGNIYSTGVFQMTADFDPGNGVHNLTSNGFADIFIQKTDSIGQLLWVKQLGKNNWNEGTAVTTDDSANIYIAGHFNDTVDFDPGTNIQNKVSSGGQDLFILKLDSTGNFIWVKQMDGQLNAGISSIHLDSLGNIYTTGWFWGTKDFDPSNQSSYPLTSLGGTDIFIQKLSPNGSLLWAQKIGGTYNDMANDIATDSRLNVYIATKIQDVVPGIPNTSVASNNGCLMKYTASGSLNHSTLIGSSINSISIDQQDNIYATGHFYGTKDFDPSTSNSLLFTSIGVENGFIQKLDNSNNLIWVHHLSSSNSAYGVLIEVDDFGAVTVAGQFNNDITLNSNQSSQTFTSQSNFYNTFIQKLDLNGNSIWQGQTASSDLIRPTSLTIDHLGNTICTGIFKGNANFNPNDSSYFINGGQSFNTFTQKLRKCIIVDSIDIISCNSYRWQHNNQLLRKSGLYSDTIISSTYCDSASSLNLSLDLNSTVSQNSDTLLANDTNALYQWIDCMNGDSAITGDTNRMFIPPYSGSFAVVLTTDTCVDTSSCIPYTLVGLNNQPSPNQRFKVFPNPTNGFLYYHTESIVPIQFISTKGKLLHEVKINQTKGKLNLSFLKNGIYLVKQNNHIRKIIVNQ